VSRAVVDVEVPFARFGRELEANVPVRVADDRGRDIGVAGYLDTTVDRGPFSFAPSASGRELVVRTTLKATARACTSRRGCYASCAPEAVAEVTVAPLLGADYALPHPHLAVRLVRGCRVSALGGLVSVDLTPTIEAQLGPQVARVEREIAARLPQVRPQIERAYAELAKPHPLPLGAGCAEAHPSGIVQGPAHVGAGAVTLRVAVLVSPEIVPVCGAEVPTPLPPLTNDPTMAPEGDVLLGEHVPLTRFRAVRVGTAASYPSAVAVRANGTDVSLRATLSGDLCGDVLAHATPGLSADGGDVTLDHVHLDATEEARLAALRVSPLDATALLQGTAVAPLKITPDRLKTALPALLPALSTSDVTLEGKVVSARPEAAQLAGDTIVATTRARLSLTAKVTR